jgi:hypothetical protein
MNSEYTVGQKCKFQLEDGSMVACLPGDQVPVKAILQNESLWVKSGILVPKPGTVVVRGPLKHIQARVSTQDDIERARPTPAPRPGEPIASLVEKSNSVVTTEKKITREQLEVMTKKELMNLASDAAVKVSMISQKSDIIDKILDAQG